MLIWSGSPEEVSGFRVPCREFGWTLMTLAVIVLTGWVLAYPK